MSDIVIHVENLSKLYHIGVQQERHDTMRDTLSHLFRRKAASEKQVDETKLWALKDVSFEVKRGEVVGIIGRNGAGKSTLLKILSRITEPTSGYAKINGRIASLLEVGTGFHPELTGRENIYLNGAILGMHRHEIQRKFDEIVAFAEIEKFLDTPVKRYSSGMYVRLAFAVAAHLEPEILLVDEVLAVGDAEFQKKCLGKMGAVAQEGRTVLFVSHNMAAIEQLCKRCLLIAKGGVEFDGDTRPSIAHYLEDRHEIRGAIWGDGIVMQNNDCIRIVSVICEPTSLFIGSCFSIRIHYLADSPQDGLMFGISIETSFGQRIIGSYTGREGLATGLVNGEQCTKIHFPNMTLLPGEYFVTIAIHQQDGENIVRLERAASFQVIASDLTGSGYLVDQRNGLVWLDHEWDITGTSNL